MPRKKMTTEGYQNKKMDSSVYAERRIVMDYIYKAKNLLRKNGIEMPRVDIRITTPVNGEIACGKARMQGNIIWINERYIKSRYLYQVVLHELCHTLWGIDHDNDCLLMHPNVQSKLTSANAEKIFLKYAKKHSEV